ncbi:MAG: hypothetical protein DRN15_06485 [Thermoprotei archaeon]|nr:MAG: hypothetical protein DRN15_06485 [Thermoprotei archaeon]RLF25483.1 MAG: hypothetical protein DRM97_01600 [Thermoprotei archaeon]
MRSRELVLRAIDNDEVPRVPIHIEAGDPDIESSLGDVVAISARIRELRDFENGGPFARGEMSLKRWIESLELDSFPWPEPHEVAERISRRISRLAKEYSAKGRFIMCKVLGPTETCESLCMPPRGEAGRRLGQIYHEFDYAKLVILDYTKARGMFERVYRVIREVVRAAAEIESVDAVRIADDACDYGGYLYPRRFIEELYLPRHKELAMIIRRGGKAPILHCDGDIVSSGLAERLKDYYKAFHPLDLVRKSTQHSVKVWLKRVEEAKAILKENAFFTGLLIELLYDDTVEVEDFVLVVGELMKRIPRGLVLSTTHRPYPGRSVLERKVLLKINAVKSLLLKV